MKRDIDILLRHFTNFWSLLLKIQMKNDALDKSHYKITWSCNYKKDIWGMKFRKESSTIIYV